MIVRNNRQVTRIFFLLVLGAAFFGGWYASTHWQPQPEALDPSLFDGGGIDWIDVAAALGEEALQLFLGLTSSGN
jgi:hypothetical protein